MIDKELAAGIDPKNVFLCGFSQGGLPLSLYIYHTFGVCKPNTTDIMMNMAGALTLASTLLYPKTLGGGAVFSGWVPFNSTSTIIEQITAEAKQVRLNKK
ncbi:putative alpha/Beta hydrolase [Helianthus annuus]|nr:putative alpha/Beta hydrolase [Helianthus annuus]